MRDEKEEYEDQIKNQAKDLRFQKKIVSTMTKKYNNLEADYEDIQENHKADIDKYNDTINELRRKLKKANKKIDYLLDKKEDEVSATKDDDEDEEVASHNSSSDEEDEEVDEVVAPAIDDHRNIVDPMEDQTEIPVEIGAEMQLAGDIERAAFQT